MPRSLSGLGATLIGWLAIVSQSWALVGAPVPEIDTTGALTGLAVLGGVLAVVAERKRQR
jgi:hypothetical protein